MTYSAIGGVIWAAGLTILGYYLGHIEFVQKNIDIIAVLIIVLSLVPAAIEWMRARREKGAQSA
jgi:membrane-associated protein